MRIHKTSRRDKDSLNERFTRVGATTRHVDHRYNTAELKFSTVIRRERRLLEIHESHDNITNTAPINHSIKDTIKRNQSLASKNASKNLNFDSKNALETAHVHIYTENPCKNDAALVFFFSGTRCVCKPGFKGNRCQDKDHCFSRPCRNNATCMDRKTRYECLCKNGFKGLDCEMKDNCFPDPCLNNGICHDQKGVIRCSCQRGFKGVNCKDMNTCEVNPCKNGGTCIQLEGNKFFCKCLPEYNGTICQARNRCVVNPCRNGGTCVNDNRKPVCQCAEGYVAEYCQDYVCKPNPCIHGGTCKPKKKLNSWDFQCSCPKRFKGNKCEVPQPCVLRPCMHGRCIDTTSQPRYERLSGGYLCFCDKGYTGKNCRKKICDSCDVNAKCVSGQCVCNSGYLGNGLTCSLSYTSGPCSVKPCKNNGVCVDLDDRIYDCRCATGYTGPNCETRMRCFPNPCKNKGTCFENGDTFRCVCPKQFKGKDCSQIVIIQDKCTPNPCKNDGTCRTSEDGQRAFCKCPSFKFKAPFCECDCPKAKINSQKGSSDSFCDKKGDCICPRSNMYLTPWGCVSAILMDNPCSSKPCSNNATCYNLSTIALTQDDRRYGCRCKPGFTGSRCQTKLPDPCFHNPCRNNGTCKSSKGVAVCFCKSGFAPPYCYRPEPGVSKCYPNPCLNEGECFEKDTRYDCRCKEGFTGTHCQVTVDDCKGCNYTYTFCFRGKCVCKPGFVGDGKYCVPTLKGSKVTRHPVIYVARRSKLAAIKSENNIDVSKQDRPGDRLSNITDIL